MALADESWETVTLCEHLDARAHAGNAGRTNEDHLQRTAGNSVGSVRMVESICRP